MKWALLWLILPILLTRALPARAELLDDMRQPGLWAASASDQVKASLRASPDGAGLCLHYDFAGVSGYAVMRRELPVNWPAQFELAATVRASGAVNDFQLKLVDASGDNVWWANRPDARLPTTWQVLSLRRRHLDFAWGPGADRQLKQTRFVELVVAAGRDRGRGSLCLARLTLTERPADPPEWPAAQAHTTAGQLTLDYGLPREFNGLSLQWPVAQQPFDYAVQASINGRTWRALRRVQGSRGGVDALFLPESEARWLRVVRSRGGALPEVILRNAAAWPNFNAVLTEQARQAPRGDLPRAFLGEQNYWTLVGVDGGGAHSALLSEDGAIEVGRRGYSIEPSVLLASGERLSWANAKIKHQLRDGYLPLPQVQMQWQQATLNLRIEAAADGPRDAPTLLARYHIHNTSDRPQSVLLMLALRPWQANPPQQFLSTPGGAREVNALRWRDGALWVNGSAGPRPTQAPQRVSALPLDAGLSLAALQAAPALHVLSDPQAHASAALHFRITLPPGGEHTVGWAAPLNVPLDGPLSPTVSRAELDRRFEQTAARWAERLNRVVVRLPASAQPLADTLRSSLAHILMSRNGAALRPGTRAYARSWIRDGAMMVAGLLRLGEVSAAREFVDWFGPQIFASGKVPCCIDARGADPVVENDSHGQYLYALAELWRHTGERELLVRHWPQVQRVMAWQEALRQSERSAANQTPSRAHLFGLLPPSISHEGYSDKPAYSYWDNFWALRGMKDAAQMARALGHGQQAAAWQSAREEFERELIASISATAVHHRIDFIAGAADRGDFDATSTTVALHPTQVVLPATLLAATFERYWREMSERSAGRLPWRDFTPYELRNVGALLRLGQPGRAHAMLDFFMRHQRPSAWRQWAEVVLPDPREPRFLGDMPHAWVGSDFIQAGLDLLAYEREADSTLVIGAGLKPEWLAEPEIGLSGLSTSSGPLSWRLLRREGGWAFTVNQAGAPLRLVWPGQAALPAARHADQLLVWQGRELTLPATLRAPYTVHLTSPP